MSNLISDNQRSTAQEPEVEQPPIPKPPRKLQEFDPSSQLAELEEQKQTDASTSFAVGESIEFVAPQQENVVGLTDYFGDKLGSGGVQVQIPQVPAASTPPMINLWKDAAVDLGIPNLADQRLVTTTSPRPYADPLTYGSQFGSTETFVQGAAANARADAQEQANRTAAIAKAAQDFQNARGNLPNTPDASKPWHEQLWGWAGDVLQGTERERAEENRTGKGTFGAYGSGLGGFFKSVFGVPIAAATATYLETWGRDEYNMQRRLLRAGNPTVRTERITADGKRMSIEAPYNSLSDEEKHKYLTEIVSNRLPLGTGALVRTNVDFRKAFGTYIYDAFAGNVNDSINEANPKLAPVIDRRTGKPAVAKPARGLLQSANLRPGQEWYEDGGGTALEIATQLFSPGNKVDAAGELLGLGFKLLGRTNVAKQAGRALVNTVPKPLKQGAAAVAGAGKRTAQAIRQGNFGSKPSVAPISQPTQVVGLPQNRGADFEAYIRNKPPVVPNVPAFNPKQTPFAPKTDPEGLAVVVGIGQKGQPLTFEPTVGVRTHQELVEQVLKQNPERFGSYKGSTWEDWEQWKKINLGEEDLRQLEAVGAELMPPRVQMGAIRESSLGSTSTNELNPPRVQQDARLQGGELAPLANESNELAPPRVQMTATLDDLQTQQRLLVEQKLSLEAPLKQLEETFDEVVDVGRREKDELPLRSLTDADLQKAIDYGSSLRLSRQLPPSVVQAAARGDWESFLSQAEVYGGVQALLQKNNAVLEDLSSVVQVPATTKLTKALPPVVYHGTALEQWQAYNLTEFGSRGELGSALYTTALYDEAVEYSRATVGNNRSVEVAYEPLSPQVIEFSTRLLQAPLDARLSLSAQDELVQSLLRNLPSNVRQQLEPLQESVSFADLTSSVDVAVAKAGGSEELLQQTSASVSDTLRAQGYDSVHDPDSGWVAVVDNGKLEPTNTTKTNEPNSVEAAVARYNSDSRAAGSFPTHVTSDANLRDSTYQLLDTARNQLDERLEEVQQQLAEATSKDQPTLTSAVARTQGYDELRAKAKEPPSVERYVRDIREFGQPLHPVLVRQRPFNGRSNRVTYEVYGNPEAYEAAVMSFGTTYRQVLAVVEGEGVQLVDILSIQKKSFSQTPLPSTKEEALAVFNKLTPEVAPSPVVLEETSLGVLRVLDRGYTANAYKQLKQKQVPAVVVGLDGKATARFADLSSIEKKTKTIEPSVPPLETIVQPPTEKLQSFLNRPKASVEEQMVAKPPERSIETLSMKELREIGYSLGVKGNSKQKLIERIEEAKAKANAPKWTGLLPDRAKVLNKRMSVAQPEQQPTSVVEQIVVEELTPSALKLEVGDYIEAEEFYTKALASYTKEQQEAIMYQLMRDDVLEPTFAGGEVPVAFEILKPVEISEELLTKAKVLQKTIANRRLSEATEELLNSVGVANFVKQMSEEDKSKLIGLSEESDVALKDTVVGSIAVDKKLEFVADKAVRELTDDFSTLGIKTPKVDMILFLGNSPDEALLQRLFQMDTAEFIKYGGWYSSSTNTLVVRIGTEGYSQLKTVFYHEYFHALDYHLNAKGRETLEEILQLAKETNYFSSNYSLKNRAEFFAELSTNLFSLNKSLLGGVKMPPELRQNIISKLKTIELESKPKAFENLDDSFVSYLHQLRSTYDDIGEYAEETLAVNPHASLREAIDSTVDDSPNICKF